MKNFFKPNTFGDEYSDSDEEFIFGEIMEEVDITDEDSIRVEENLNASENVNTTNDPDYEIDGGDSDSDDSSMADGNHGGADDVEADEFISLGDDVDDDDEDEEDEDDLDDDDDDDDDEFVTYAPHRRRFGFPKNSGSSSTQQETIEEEMDKEDAVIQRIIAETKKERNHPPDITTDDFVFDLCFHPLENILGVGTITGDVILYKYSNEENQLIQTLEVHTKAVRKINFNEDGKLLYSVSKDKTIMISDVETGKLKLFFEKSHENPIYTLSVINEHIFATGDDDGILKVWDLRQRQNKASFELRLAEDYISQIITNDEQKILVCSSGDGYLNSVNIRAKKQLITSEPYEEELNCMGLFRNDSKLVVGSSKGKLYSYNWGEFGIHSDMFNGPKTGINVMVPITNRIAVVAGEEGILRAMHVVPGRNLGIVGQHALGVEALDICNTGELIASCSHDHDIKFWNIKYFEDFDDIKYSQKSDDKRAIRHNLPSSKRVNASDFFSDLANDT